MKIVHVLQSDKFTSGYVNFMKKHMSAYEHYFLLQSSAPLPLWDAHRVFYVETFNAPLPDDLRAVLEQCDRIIFSGVFSSIYLLQQFPPRLLRKTYLQFWGGDFYNYLAPPPWFRVRTALHRRLRKRLYDSCAGHIFLIEGEEKEYRKFFAPPKTSFVAPMPSDDLEQRCALIHAQREAAAQHEGIHILVGNSATASNNHKQVLDRLRRFTNENIKIFMPLSYGDPQYRDEVIRYAQETCGDRVVPVTHYMDKFDYLKFLSTMDIGIIDCNRQQGMGNIIYLLALGKKIYLRPGTSMWDMYRANGYAVYDSEAISAMPFEEFARFDAADRAKNETIADETLFSYAPSKHAWKIVFDHA